MFALVSGRSGQRESDALTAGSGGEEASRDPDSPEPPHSFRKSSSGPGSEITGWGQLQGSGGREEQGSPCGRQAASPARGGRRGGRGKPRQTRLVVERGRAERSPPPQRQSPGPLPRQAPAPVTSLPHSPASELSCAAAPRLLWSNNFAWARLFSRVGRKHRGSAAPPPLAAAAGAAPGGRAGAAEQPGPDSPRAGGGISRSLRGESLRSAWRQSLCLSPRGWCGVRVSCRSLRTALRLGHSPSLSVGPWLGDGVLGPSQKSRRVCVCSEFSSLLVEWRRLSAPAQPQQRGRRRRRGRRCCRALLGTSSLLCAHG